MPENRKLIECGKSWFEGHGIKWSEYDSGKFEEYNDLAGQIEWTHKTSGNKIVLSEVWYEGDEILQAGSNYGNLTL